MIGEAWNGDLFPDLKAHLKVFGDLIQTWQLITHGCLG